MIQVCGNNKTYVLGEKSNNKCPSTEIICPPLKLYIDITSILSYSIYHQYAIMVKKKTERYMELELIFLNKLVNHCLPMTFNILLNLLLKIINQICTRQLLLYQAIVIHFILFSIPKLHQSHNLHYTIEIIIIK